VLAAEEPKNPLYEDLLNKGIRIPDGPTVKLPPPFVKPGQAPKDTAALLEKAAGRVPGDLFQKRSPNAPFSLTINSIEKGDNERCGQLISLTFIAYGKLDAVKETDFVKQLLGRKGKGGSSDEEATVLSSKELKERNIRLLDGPGRKEQYSKMTMALLNKVQVEGVMRSVRTTAPDSILSATLLEDRFHNDKTYPNIWRPIIPVGDEEEKLGPPKPYTAMGGYVLVTRLPEPKDALLVEMQFVLHEPPDWFGGLNLLRSKLPILVQDNVRSFRRKITAP
jgi:hypothetical protein